MSILDENKTLKFRKVFGESDDEDQIQFPFIANKYETSTALQYTKGRLIKDHNSNRSMIVTDKEIIVL